MHKLKYLTCLQESFFILAHQVLLHLNTGWNTPSVAFDEPEHITKTVHYQGIILIPPVGQPDTALAHHIISIIGMHILAAFHPTRQIHVIHRYL